MKTLQPVSAPYTVTERAAKIYSGVLDIFDYNTSNDVVTPLNLARIQVRQCGKIGTVCVPGAGIGTYVLAAMLEGFKPEDITAVESDLAYFGLGSGIFSRFGVNYVHADFLSWQPSMKFDVIIGNPPYQDVSNAAKNNKLWMKFVFLSLDLLRDGGHLAFVTPRSFVGRTQVPAKIRKLLSTDYSLREVNHNADSYFKVGVDICAWLAQKVPYEGSTRVLEDNCTSVIDLRTDLPLVSSKQVTDSLAEKIHEIVKRPTTKKLDSKSVEVDIPEDPSGPYKVYTSGRNKFYRTREEPLGDWKVVFSYSATYKQWFVTQSDVTGSNKVVVVDSPEEGVEIGQTLMHPVVTFYLDTWRKTSGFTPAIKNRDCVPDIRGLSEDEIKLLFELTDDEYSYIMSSYAPYSKQLQRVI
jgi:hypothetical protein